jgi:fatty acid synthase subunit alpha, fungi type
VSYFRLKKRRRVDLCLLLSSYQQINLYSLYLKRDPRQGEILYDKEKASSAQIQARLDSIACEHGDTYIDGIQPVFDALKSRHFDSS